MIDWVSIRRLSLNIIVSHEKVRVPVTILAIVGDIDSSNYERLDQIAYQEIENGTQYILIDLSGVQFMSSAAYRSITKIFKKLRSLSKDGSDEEMHKGINAGTYKSPYLKLYKPSKAVAETMKIAGFDMLLEIHHDMKAAIASF
jgi:anti-anti-sigma factor